MISSTDLSRIPRDRAADTADWLQKALILRAQAAFRVVEHMQVDAPAKIPSDGECGAQDRRQFRAVEASSATPRRAQSPRPQIRA
jgi:hypothetical protein